MSARSVLAAAAAAALAPILWSCAANPAPVIMQGSRTEIASLAGDWDGSYGSVESRRDGSITFKVRAGSDTAFGDVMMIPDASGVRIMAEDAQTRAHEAHASAPEFLRITFVHVSDGVVEGALEPYVAPDCRCVVRTVFRGTIRGDGIAGEYVTRGDGGLRQTGTWSVRRR